MKPIKYFNLVLVFSYFIHFSNPISAQVGHIKTEQISRWTFDKPSGIVYYLETDNNTAIKITESQTRATDPARVKIIQTKNGSTIGTSDGRRLRGVPMAFSASDLNNPFETKVFNPNFYKTARNMGFNAVRCFVDQPDVFNELKVNESLAILDSIVNLTSKYGLQLMLNAGNIGYFRNNEPQELIRLIEYNKILNGILTSRYKNRTHVIFEQQNEPFYDNPFAYPQYIQDMAECYSSMRKEAPDSHISLFTFMLSCGYSMLDQVKLLEKKISIDWTKTTVAYHGYGPPCKNIEKITELMKEYPVVQTEFWPEKNLGEGGFGTDYEMIGLEDNEISWFTWWLHTGQTDLTIYEPIFADLKAAGKMWNFTTIDLNEPVVNCGRDTTIFLPENSITINAKVSDPNGSIVRYNWVMLKSSGQADFTQLESTAELKNMTKGVYYLRLFAWDNEGNYSYDDVSVVVGNLQKIPGKIEAEDYSAAFGVDGTNFVGWINSGDWTEYQVEIAEDGLYSIQVVEAADEGYGGTGYFLVDGVPASSTFIAVPTGDWGYYLPVNCSVNLTKGWHTLRYEPIVAGGYNLDYFVFTKSKATIETTPDLTLKLPVNTAELVATATDPSGIKSYQWNLIQAPKGYLFSGIKNTSILNVNELIIGDYIFQVVVLTNDKLPVSKDIKVTVSACDDNPTVAAGADKKFSLPQNSVDISVVTTSGSGIGSYKWEKLSGPSAGVMNNVDSPTLNLTDLVNGIYSFKITVVSNKGCVATDEVKVKVFLPVGFNQQEISENTFEIYPNPAKLKVTIERIKWIDNNAIIQLTDVNGRVLKQCNWKNDKMEWSLEQCSRGIYFITVISNNMLIRKKLLIK